MLVVAILAGTCSDIWHKSHVSWEAIRRTVPERGRVRVRAMADDLAYRIFIIVIGLAPVVLTAGAVFIK
jgi:hypothetical protein